MTELAETSLAPSPATFASSPRTKQEGQSRRWRSVWRLHFYSGIFAMPFIVLMAVSGLVILYTQPLQNLTEGNLRKVSVGATTTSFADQTAAVERAFPNTQVTTLTVGAKASDSSVFQIDDGSTNGRQVFVDPYSGEVLGSIKTAGGFIGFANRLHGFLNVNSVKISLPTVSALWDSGAIMRPYVVGDLVLELLGTWSLVLVLSGLFLWRPRRSANRNAIPVGQGRRGILRVRVTASGRARWRDLHGVSGLLLFGAMVMTIVSGMAWSTYWGPNFTSLANEVSPNAWTDAPASVIGKRGDLDRFGSQIPWNTADAPIPASLRLDEVGTVPAPLNLDAVVRIARDEGMKPGFSIAFPANVVDEATKRTTYAPFALSNSWPRKTNEAATVYIDQFSGRNLASVTGYGYGSVSYGLDALVSTHMGTQIGMVSRILMTGVCVLALWSVISALAMFTKRRRRGTAGLPRRPTDVRLAKPLGLIALALALVFPLWGASAGVVLGFDRLVVRRNRLLADLPPSNGPRPVIAMIEILIYPMVEEVEGSEGGRNCIQFLSQLFSHPMMNLMDMWRSQFGESVGRIYYELRTTLAHVPDEVFGPRFGLMWLLAINALADRERLSSTAVGTVSSALPVLYVSNLVDTLAGLISAPVSASTQAEILELRSGGQRLA